MKEFKIRAWDKLNSEFLLWQEIIDFYDFSWLLSETNSAQNWGTSRYNVEQWTCLFDKNGVEIYEGDKVIIEKEDDEEIFIVKWDNETASFIMESETFILDFDNYGGTDCEVIGNIHEGI